MQAAIGRPLPGGAATYSVNLVNPGQLYGPRINSVDFRFTKILRFGNTRTNVGLDLYNLFNANTGTAFNQAFGERRGHVAAADDDTESAVRAVQRDVRLLIWKEHGRRFERTFCLSAVSEL